MPETSLLLILLVLAVAVAVAIVLLVALLLRKPQNGLEQSLREERNRLAMELQGQRDVGQSNSAEVARLQERIVGLERQEAELVLLKETLPRQQQDASDLRADLSVRTAESFQYKTRAETLESEAASLRRELEGLRTKHADVVAELSHSQRTNADMKEFLANAQERLSGAFAELAGKTFDERTQQAAAKSKGDLENLLGPFSKQLSEFRTRADQLYGDEAKERAALAGKVDELKTLNMDMAERANELTRALRGKSKVRGDWGEMMLESVLQGSGLVEGAHYDRQKSSNDDEGLRLQPDIVVRLPDDRRIVVDSKVNLVDWQDAMNAEKPEAQQDAMRKHSLALRQHVKELGEKNYPKAVGDGALEITIAFIPIEGALSAALGFDASLQTFAFDRKIVFASPNTLMALLRVVDRLWTKDKIQREAAEIAKVGGFVLDSLMSFLADFDNVGRQLDDARSAFNSARGKLSESNKAVIPRAQRLAQLGAKGKKALTEELQGDIEPLSNVDFEASPSLAPPDEG